MGAAGDMLMAALYELLPEGAQASFLARMNALGLPGVRVEAVPAVKGGITGTHMAVTVDGAEEDDHGQEHGQDHSHADLHNIEHRLSHLDLPEKAKGDAAAVYRLLAEAEEHLLLEAVLLLAEALT